MKVFPETITDVLELMKDTMRMSFIPADGRFAIYILIREIDGLARQRNRMKAALIKIAANDSIDSECAGLEEIARNALQGELKP